MLSRPLGDRFGIDAPLELYGDEELARVVERSARLLDVRLGDASRSTSRAARGARPATRPLA